MTHTRDRIKAHVDSNPGVNFSTLVEDLDLATGQVQYHLRKLCNSEELVREEVAGRTHYFDPDFGPTDRTAIALFRQETTRELVLVLLEDGSARPADLVDHLDLARSTVEWHLSKLIDADLVEKEYDERGRVTVELVDPERSRHLLREITPSLPDRFVDRFTRLLDQFLDDDLA